MKTFRFISTAAVAMLIISIFLPYVSTDTQGIAQILRNHGITSLGTLPHGISQFTYAMVYLNSEKAGLHSSYQIYAVLFFIEWAFILLILIFSLAEKPKAVIAFSVLLILISLLLRADYLDRGIVSVDSDYSTFGIGMYMIFVLAILEIISSIILIALRKKR